MLMQNQTIAPASLFLGLISVNPCDQATEALKSTLITGYEQAIEDGLSPMNALAMVLNWVAEEFGRVSDEARAPSSSSQHPAPFGPETSWMANKLDCDRQ